MATSSRRFRAWPALLVAVSLPWAWASSAAPAPVKKPRPVQVQVRPLSGDAVRLASGRDTVGVAVLSRYGLDATRIDPATVDLAGARPVGNARLQDADGDGRPDLVVELSTASIRLRSGATRAAFAARTVDGAAVIGSLATEGEGTTRGAGASDPNEPNDGFAAATPVACPTFASVDAAIEPLGDVDFYLLSGIPGQIVDIDVDAEQIDSVLDPVLGLFDSGFASLGVSDDDPAPGEADSLDSFLQAVIPADGVLYVAVSAYPDFDFDGIDVASAGHYSVSIDCNPPGGPDPHEPNPDFATATPISCPGVGTVQTSVDPLEDVDHYLLSGPPGALVDIDVDAAQVGSSLNSMLGTFDSGGLLLAVSDDDPAPGEPAGVDSFLQASIPADGLLYIAVTSQPDFDFDGFGGTTTGFYALNVSCSSGADEPNDSVFTAKPIICPAFDSSQSIDPLGDVDFYRLVGVPGSVIDIDVDAEELGSGLDATLGVLDSSFATLAVSDDDPAPGEPAGGFDSYLQVTVPADGLLYIAVSSYFDMDFDGSQAETVGFYRLSVTCDQPVGCSALQVGGPSGWTPKMPLPGGREGAGGVIIGDRIYVTHGASATGGDTAETSIFDIPSNSWSTGAPAFVFRADLTAVCVENAAGQGTVFAVGGRSPVGPLADVEIYDPSVDAWTTAPPMPTGRRGAGAAWVPGVGVAGGSLGSVFVIGGSNGFSRHTGIPLSANEAYDVALGVWVTRAPLPTPVMDVYSTTWFPGTGRIYVFGGYDGSAGGAPSDLVQIYDPVADAWTTGAPMPTPRSNLVSGVCGDRLFAIGGYDGAGTSLNANESYDPVTDAWFPLEPLKPTAGSAMASQYIYTGREIFTLGGGSTGPFAEAFTCGACLGDFDGDSLCDAADSCPSAADQGGVSPFAQTIVAPDKNTFSWAMPADVLQGRGDLAGVSAYALSRINTYALSTSFSDTQVPAAGAGFYYVVRPDCPTGSWTSGGPGECQPLGACPPGNRDGNLP